MSFDHDRTIESAEDAEDHIEHDLEEVPVSIVFNGKHDQLASPKRVHGCKHCGCD